jgi:predicted RNA-binding protein with PUA-like domain
LENQEGKDESMKSKKKSPWSSPSGNYWLMKSEPDVFSIDDLRTAPRQTTCWDGVRNYQARNFMRDQMQMGDLVLFYHSNATPSAIVGLAKVSSTAYPDPTAFDPNSDYFDPKSKKENPTWMMVDITFVHKFARPLPLDALRPVQELAKMPLLQKGSRLSVQPVGAAEFQWIIEMADGQPSKA